MDTFKRRSPYRPLVGTEIRLVKLLPRCQLEDPILCGLDYAPLVPALATRLSISHFAWGNPADTVLIYLNGQECLVTRNLCRGLQYLRLTDEPRTLWTDSICVNQRDMRE